MNMQNHDKALGIILDGIIALLTDYRAKQVRPKQMDVILPKRETLPPVINVIVPEQKLPDVYFSIPSLKQARPTLTVKVPVQPAPAVNIHVPETKFPKKTTERQVVDRDSNGNMVGTRAVKEFDYE